jgi:hypothetical protein
MSNSFSISNRVYDGSAGGSGNPNPLCWITGQVNGKNVFPAVFFAYLMAANSAGQMQTALTAAIVRGSRWFTVQAVADSNSVSKFFTVQIFRHTDHGSISTASRSGISGFDR